MYLLHVNKNKGITLCEPNCTLNQNEAILNEAMVSTHLPYYESTIWPTYNIALKSLITTQKVDGGQKSIHLKRNGMSRSRI